MPGYSPMDDGGWIKFIDASGKVVIDPQIPYIPGAEGYVFHNNRCIVHNERRPFRTVGQAGQVGVEA